MKETVLDLIISAIEDESHNYDQNLADKPVAILWPDKARQWKPVIDIVRGRRPLVTMGTFDPEHGEGPAYWVRCAVAGTVQLEQPGGIPVIYLPGISRGDLRGITSNNQELAPLASLQHRSQWFCQSNGNDWTIRAFFANKDRGLGLSVGADEATTDALIGGIAQLIDQPMTRFGEKHIDASFLNNLVNPDVVRLLLQWIDDPAVTQSKLGPAAWGAFLQQCRGEYGFDPALDGVLVGAQQLGTADGPWRQVWQRFRESPREHSNIPSRLLEAQPGILILPNPGAWPGPANDDEKSLRTALTGLRDVPASEALNRTLQLEEDHKARRGYVWADLGWTPLALALEHLAEAARNILVTSPSGSVNAITEWYATTGWKVDRSVLRALAEVEQSLDIDAVASVLNAIYRPWVDQAARQLQAAVGPEANAGRYLATTTLAPKVGEVVIFVDGLRLDVAHLLADRLESNAEVTMDTALAALPTVTQTAKPAVVPIDQALLGPGTKLDACKAPGGTSAGIQVLRSLLTAAGIQVLGTQEVGDPGGRAWTESGEIDHKGHDLGFRLAHEIEDQVQRIARRILDLLAGGWVKVTVVTDHGWLLLPSGLPKNEGLPIAATLAKKGRCARIKDGALVNVPTVPWHWDKDVRIALASGISCFEANKTYEHGGVSPQECIVPRLIVKAISRAMPTKAEITSIKWRGLTLVVEFSELPAGTTVDLRRHPGDAKSSMADMARVTGGSGKIILLVEDEDLEGIKAHLVVVGADGTLLLQRETKVALNQ